MDLKAIMLKELLSTPIETIAFGGLPKFVFAQRDQFAAIDRESLIQDMRAVIRTRPSADVQALLEKRLRFLLALHVESSIGIRGTPLHGVPFVCLFSDLDLDSV